MNEDDSRFGAEVEFLFSLTRNFSNSFEIKHERIRNWRMLGIAINRERDGLIPAGTLRRAIKPLIRRGRSTDNLHSWVNKFVDEFGNDAGPFLERVSRPARPQSPADAAGGTKRHRSPNTTHYALTSNFNACARRYVEGLLEHTEFRQDARPPITDQVIRQVVRVLFKFQTKIYWDLWLQLLKQTSLIAGSIKYFADISPDTIRLLHWIIIMQLWRSSLDDKNKGWDSIDINGVATNVLVVVDPDELSKVIDFLASEKGGKILVERKEAKTNKYYFNSEYASAARAYITASMLIRPQWRADFARALVMQQ
jgi:hypothetical protein